jgi:hypothetical protein
MSGVGEVKEMVVEAVVGTSGVYRGLAADGAEVGSGSSAGSKPAESAEAVLRLIRTNGKVQSAIMDLVLSSPYVQWEL